MAFKAQLPKISAGRAARYMLLPEILPRIRAFGGSGFGYLAFLIASVYQAVRILPAGHPFTRPGNIGTFGLRDVLVQAAGHVKLEWRNVDQIIIYFAVIAAIIILALQFVALALLLVSGQAFAQGSNNPGDYSFFVTAAPAKDVAYMLLDHVFGIPDFFKSSAPTNTPFHQALHALFHFYNFAILLIAALIFLYYILVVVVETAQTGTPFGQRFNTIYAPIRLVIALGLLVPLNYGLNAAQYITLYAAKVGSSFATNAWLNFNNSIDNPLGIEKDKVIAMPTIPDIGYMVDHMALVHTCAVAYKKIQDKDIEVFLIVDGIANKVAGTSGSSFSMDYKTAIQKTGGGDIKLTFGWPQEEKTHDDKIIPYCGVINIPVSVYSPKSKGANSNLAYNIAYTNYVTFESLWVNKNLKKIATDTVNAVRVSKRGAAGRYKPDQQQIESTKDHIKSVFEYLIQEDFKNYKDDVDISLDDETKARGWGGAGIWYNKIAQMNGDAQAALNAQPAAVAYPMVMMKILEQKRGSDAGFSDCSIFRPNLADNRPVEFDNKTYDPTYARIFYIMQRGLTCDVERKTTSNIFWDAMHMVFGVQGLFDMRCNNANNVHPLAQLTTIGKSLMDSSVRNMTAAMFTAAGGGITVALGSFGGDLSAMGQAASGYFVTMATIGLSLGFLLFYILPFMPFLYFFFAVGAWVKEVFEAMVGAPLWALAHIKIDGDGLPGRSAMNGYYLIFEIFLRPILIVTGLIGGMVIFSASVHVLNQIFDTAVLRLTGIDIDSVSICSGGTATPPKAVAGSVSAMDELDKHILDEFFFTVMYAIFVYMIAMSCFKMIDLVPNSILRWLGGGASPFASEVQDPADSLGQWAAMSGSAIGGKVIGGLKDLSAAGGTAVGGIGAMAQSMGQEKQQ